MLTLVLALAAGLTVLLWSADRFVASASGLAGQLGLSPLLIGMIVVGFGTSAPEMTVSVFATWQGNPGIALGNAYGSNITNIALILGLTALIRPIAVQSAVLNRELPILLGITLLAAWQLYDGTVTRLEAIVLLLVFTVLLGWSIIQARRHPDDPLAVDSADSLEKSTPLRGSSLLWLLLSLIALVLSSRLLVWAAVGLAQRAGMSDLVIGLTVVAIGTSLPELASSLVAARRGENELAVGNIIGSNLFNTLIVVGLAGLVAPLPVNPVLMLRDWPVMFGLSLALLVFGIGLRRPGRINRLEGGLLLTAFVIYTAVLIQWQ
ncbi:calcium/sodium antiporter [Wenzhouxiangella marina]|uniref:Calcium/sodium:proton antiporter n=1 Tax=Wenzhouxiangella marina TaxID=1579979 RepID=A0A0K0Y057_9GAMM|nr:calcium/sodium antiporter [Wenzhouxiangella marina]AKS43272.1 Calcium/sodium:proton antiporter [Wenzhouxiangella marina]MBB6087041.1 cation:H+ antiporter [Wenzhouxiangella marina]